MVNHVVGYDVLDHYYLKLRNNCYAVVVGNAHSAGYVVGYQKYCAGSRQVGPWHDSLNRYRRLVPVYDPVVVHESTPWRTYIHSFGCLTPIIPRDKIIAIYDPIQRTYGLIYHPRDRLEVIALELIDIIKMYAGNVSIGITGSILVGIHAPDTSDIDLVVYGWRDSLKVIEALSETVGRRGIVRTFNEHELALWSKRLEERLGISREAIRKYFYRPWRRGKVEDIDYSIIYNDGVARCLDLMEPWKNAGYVKAKICVENRQLSALNYPSEALIYKYEFLQGKKYELRTITSFEALYIPFLYEGGCAIVEGLLQKSSWYRDYRIVLGVYEHRGKLIPVI